MTPHIQVPRAPQVFTLLGGFLFTPSCQVGWSHRILICERHKPSLSLTWVLFALPGIGSSLRLQGGLAFSRCVIGTCLHQDRGMPQQDKVLWEFRLLLLASSKGNYFSATHVELPIANTETFCGAKAAGPLVFTTPKMQPSHQSKSKAKPWISYWRLDLVKLDLPKKSFLAVLILLIWAVTQSFPYWNSAWIEWGEARTCGLHRWKDMLRAGIMGFGRNRTAHSTWL